MTDQEVVEHLREWCKKPNLMPFTWPTDPCGYDQHIRFVHHRNKYWNGPKQKDFVPFVSKYADRLEAGMIDSKGNLWVGQIHEETG
jgi:hypothetical protein